MNIEDIPKDKTICVRSAGKEASSGNGQGMLKCFCTGKCMNKKWKCKNHGLQCNSRCSIIYFWNCSYCFMNSLFCTNNDIDALEIQIIEIVLYLNTNLHSIVYFLSCSDSWSVILVLT